MHIMSVVLYARCASGRGSTGSMKRVDSTNIYEGRDASVGVQKGLVGPPSAAPLRRL
jgi:hypothetical protein